MIQRIASAALLVCLAAPVAAQKYKGPIPPKNDLPFLVHADSLVETELATAQESKVKDALLYSLAGASAKPRTPLAEPVFLIQTSKLDPRRLSLYRFEVKNGRRELTLPTKPKKDSPRPLRVTVTQLGEGLYKLEASENLENGEYGLSPEGSNDVFCFSVY
ncbi:MAG: hypothetical protein FJW40_22745 [Acidobacteria bacterium]|nr:hypothetical protein [Acidobacteriota bacterium]